MLHLDVDSMLFFMEMQSLTRESSIMMVIVLVEDAVVVERP